MTSPSLAIDIKTKIIPAMIVAICRPAKPYCIKMPLSKTINAPVGPAICTREPPKIETKNAEIIAV